MKYIQSQFSLEHEVNNFAAKFQEYMQAVDNGKELIDPTKIITLENQARMLMRKLKGMKGTEKLRETLSQLLQHSSSIEAREDLQRAGDRYT